MALTLESRRVERRVNKAELAAWFEVSLPTIEAWIRKGMPIAQRGSRGVPWVIDLLEVAEWRFSGRADNDGEIDPERLSPSDRKAWYEGEARRRDLQERDRELIPAIEVEQAIRTAFAAIGQSLRSIPDNLERRVGISPAVAEQIEEMLDEEMTALADRLANLTPGMDMGDEA